MVGTIKKTQGGAGPTINIRGRSLLAPVKDVKPANYMPGVQALALGAARGANRRQADEHFNEGQALTRERMALQEQLAAEERAHQERMAAEARKNRLNDYAWQKQTDANIKEEDYQREIERDTFRTMTPEQLRSMGFTPQQIEIIPHAPPGTAMKMREANRQFANKSELARSAEEARFKVREMAAQRKQATKDAATKVDIKRTMEHFNAMAGELSQLTDSAVKSGIGALGSNSIWQAMTNWWASGGENGEARRVINQYLGSLEADLMGTLKGNPSDRDVEVALKMVRDAQNAETPVEFYKALKRAQEIMARKAGLKPDEFKPFEVGKPASKEETKKYKENTIAKNEKGERVQLKQGRWVPIPREDAASENPMSNWAR